MLLLLLLLLLFLSPLAHAKEFVLLSIVAIASGQKLFAASALYHAHMTMRVTSIKILLHAILIKIISASYDCLRQI